MLNRILLLCLAVLMASSIVFADESKVPEPFRGDTPGSPIAIRYDDWSLILKRTVIDGGLSDRKAAPKVRATTGTRLVSGNTSSTRNEGNRLAFPVFEGDNLTVIHNIRKQLEAIPNEVAMKHWDKNEQLAYWLNLYNITLIEQLAHEYPIKNLKKLMKSSRKNPSLWDRKVLNVAGVPLSLNDIHHTILINKWDSTIIMYGLFQGYIGGPNIQNQAYTGDNVHSLLVENAKEFVNSNRGLQVKGNTLQISELYEVNEALFPNWRNDLKKHFSSLVDFSMRSSVRSASKIKAKTKDYYIADLFGGGARGAGSSLATNSAALNDMQVAVVGGESFTGASAGIGNFSSDTFLVSFQRADIDMRFPDHVTDYLKNMQLRNGNKKGRVEIEEFENTSKENTENNQ
ncbi:MAG: DUF547 domain-containing protein [Alphaproteobacteria bacterium]|nr:DUF547 domain-containing protein [Alphaproteobacteria bacterium]